MATLAGPLVDTVLRRVRDPQGSAHPRDMVRWFLSLAQQVANAGLRSVFVTTSFTTTPFQQVYTLNGLFPNAVRIEAIREGDRNLARVGWPELAQVDRRWSRRTGQRFEVWAPIGRDLFVIHPAQPAAATVTVVADKLTNSLSADTTVVELTVGDLPVVADLTEAVLDLRARLFEPATAALERLAVAYKASQRT